MTLRLYTNDTDTVVANSAKEALNLWCAEFEEDPKDHVDSFYELPDDKMLTIIDQDGGEDWEGGRKSQLHSEWAREHGPGFLCSTEY